MKKTKSNTTKNIQAKVLNFNESNNKLQSDDLSKFDMDIPKENSKAISKLLSDVKDSNKLITETAKQCIDYIQSAEKGIEYINEHSGFFERISSAISGKTGQTRLKSEQDLANSQRCCIQIINEMNKKMLVSQEQILMLENLVNYLVVEEDEFRKELQDRLINIFNSVKKRFELIEKTIYDLSLREANTRELVIKLEEKLGKEIEHLWNRTAFLENYILKVERQVETLEWIQLIRAYDNFYDQIKGNRIILFLTAVFDFYKYKKGNFSYKDLLLFSSALRQLGFEVEESLTLDNFFDEYIDALYPEDLYEEVDNFLDFKSRKQKEIKKLYKEGYYSIGTDQTTFITALNVTNYIIEDNIMNDKSPEMVKKELKTFREKSGLNFDKPFNWFLIACEILSYKRIALLPPEEDYGSRTKELINSIEKGKGGNYLIKQDVRNLYLDKVVFELTTKLSGSPYTRNFIGLKKFLSSDPYSYISYAENVDAIQFEIDLTDDNAICQGIYTKSSNDRLMIICALLIHKDIHKELSNRINQEYNQIKIEDFHSDYDTFGYCEYIKRNGDNLEEVSSQLSNQFVELLEILSKNKLNLRESYA